MVYKPMHHRTEEELEANRKRPSSFFGWLHGLNQEMQHKPEGHWERMAKEYEGALSTQALYLKDLWAENFDLRRANQELLERVRVLEGGKPTESFKSFLMREKEIEDAKDRPGGPSPAAPDQPEPGAGVGSPDENVG